MDHQKQVGSLFQILLTFSLLLMSGVLGGLLVSRVSGQLMSRVSDGLLMVSDVQLTSDELLRGRGWG